MLVGYMRVSTDGDRQTFDLQRDALLTAGVDERHLFEDRVSGSRGERAGLAKALAFIKSGDCLVVWKLDRLGPLTASPAYDGERSQGARHRLSFAHRANGHRDAARRIPLSCVRRVGAI